jgi:glycine/D-amino acid oxidase-like deaminating enzyme
LDWCRQQGRDPRELPLIIESLRLWHDMNHRVDAQTGFVTCGIASLHRWTFEASSVASSLSFLFCNI